MAENIEPVLLATRVHLDPGSIFVLIGASFGRALLETDIHRKLARIEGRKFGLQTLEQIRRPAGEPQLPPRHPAGYHVPPQTRGRKHCREVQCRHAKLVRIGDAPDRRGLNIVRSKKPDMYAVAALKAEEIKNTVLSRATAGHQRRP